MEDGGHPQMLAGGPRIRQLSRSAGGSLFFRESTRPRFLVGTPQFYPRCRAGLIREWLNRVDVDTLFIEPGSPWENGYVESFNGKFRDEFLDREILYTLQEAKVLIERWRKEYNTIRPHSSLGYRPPAPEAVRPFRPASAPLQPPETAFALT